MKSGSAGTLDMISASMIPNENTSACEREKERERERERETEQSNYMKVGKNTTVDVNLSNFKGEASHMTVT